MTATPFPGATIDVQAEAGHPLPRYRSLPEKVGGTNEIAGHGWHLDDLVLPALTLRLSSLQHNISLHAAWCAANGVQFAPHAKTHLSPELVGMQMQSGAWGMTAATAHQVRWLAAVGVRRIILAHQVADRPNIRLLAALLLANPDLAVYVLVDSEELIVILNRELTAAGITRPLQVLLELGSVGGRTGVRDPEALISMSSSISSSRVLVLAGVECFEGVLPVGRTGEHLEVVDAMLNTLADAVRTLDAKDMFNGVSEILFTAGGSVYPDRVAAAGSQLTGLSLPVRTVVRSGGTVVHDYGDSARNAPLAPEAKNPLGGLRPALELWATVVSTPEPGVALAAFGKRDSSFDSGMPVVLGYCTQGGQEQEPQGITVTRLNDQHAYLSHDGGLQVGHRLRLGPIHPCTVFDKWPLIPLLDDDDGVIGAVTTWF